ncbi:hypothetical protein [Aquisphaera insulae]|uniref:hypothetical protein n=1 Tax=Aquisphaera insulae TaxID=2712864 RepID=UPI0013EBAF06|nr:hypothetical protein [Aquisphaera insulae]
MKSSPNRRFVLPLLLIALSGPGCTGMQSRLAWRSKGQDEPRIGQRTSLFRHMPDPVDAAGAMATDATPRSSEAAPEALAHGNRDSEVWPSPSRQGRLSRWFPQLSSRNSARTSVETADPYGRFASPLAAAAIGRGRDSDVRTTGGDDPDSRDVPSGSGLVLGDPEPLSGTTAPRSAVPPRPRPMPHELPRPAGDVALEVRPGDLPATDGPALVETPPELSPANNDEAIRRADDRQPRLEEHLQTVSISEVATEAPGPALAMPAIPAGGTTERPLASPSATPPLDASAPTEKSGSVPVAAPSLQPPPLTPRGDSPPPIPAPPSVTPPTTPTPKPPTTTTPKPPAPAPAQSGQKPTAPPSEPKPSAEPGPKPITPGQEATTPTAPAPAVPTPAPAAPNASEAAADVAPPLPAIQVPAATTGQATEPAGPQAAISPSNQSRSMPYPTTWRSPAASAQAPSPQTRPTASAQSASAKPAGHGHSFLSWLHDLKHPKGTHAAAPRSSPQSVAEASPSPQLPAIVLPTSYGKALNAPCPRPATTVLASPQSPPPAPVAKTPSASPQSAVATSGHHEKAHLSWLHWGILSETVHKMKGKLGDGCSCSCHSTHGPLPGKGCTPCSGPAGSSKCRGIAYPWASPQGSIRPASPQAATVGSGSPQASRVPKAGELVDRIASKGLDETPER